MGPGFVRRDVRYKVPWAIPAGIAALQWGPASFAGMCARNDPKRSGRSCSASMGPGFVRRDVLLLLGNFRSPSNPLQWGPASFAGMCMLTASVRSFRATVLQWGPASFAGMCVFTGGAFIDR